VLDLRGGTGLPATVATLRRHHPETGVVIVATTLDPALLLEAMRAGVNEVVTDPVTQPELEQAILRAIGHRFGAETGEVFGVIGAKGGVGATTVAVNAAVMLGALAKPDRALLVDFHPAGGDAAVFLSVEPRFSILEAPESMHRLDANLLHSLVMEVAPRTDLLASPERAIPGRVDTAKVRGVLEFIATAYKFAVVDLPRSDGALLDALDPLTRIFVVANQELATVKSAGRLSASLRERYGRDKVAVVISRSDRQAEIAHADVERVVGSQVVHTFPSQYRLALQALNKGRPIALDNHNDLSASFRRFASELAGARAERTTPANRAGLLGRLTGRS
jgi:pilus assembly protein CpaE